VTTLGPAAAPPTLSVVTPAFNEAENLPRLYPRLVAVLEGLDLAWEWIVVDDHSGDASSEALRRLAEADSRVRVIRLTRNFGSHAAIACGLDAVRGDVAVVMAADLQDSPESVPRLLERWRHGVPVVWGARADAGPGARRSVLSRAYERVIRRAVGADSLPPTDADFVVLDRVVVDAVRRCAERRAHIFMLIAWLGYRQESVPCLKAARVHGRSGWTWAKKVELAMDSIVAFTERPLRWIIGLGIGTAFAGLVYALVVIANSLLGRPVAGWSSLMVVVLVVGGGQMLMLGVIGAYVWRGLDETRRRPRYVIESTTDDAGVDAARRRTG
jgi:polyisoprenyl-phosphate glycosyltransferase